MGSEHVNAIAPGVEPELHLLITDKQFEEPLYKSLFRELDEFFFPKKLPPLKLESKPEPVRDIWGFYDYKKNGVLGSTGVHVLIVAVVVAGALIERRLVKAAPQTPKVTVTLVDPGDLPVLKPSKTQAGGGGGGGVRRGLAASHGKPPKLSIPTIPPPGVVLREAKPRLAVE